MHNAVTMWVKRTLRARLPGNQQGAGLRVLEIGSLNINGSVRIAFKRAQQYTGIDRAGGKAVDIVTDARDYDGGGQYDVVVSTEAMEHDPDPRAIVECAARALKPGGLFIVTAAGPGRKPHSCRGGRVGPDEHYRNVEPAELEAMLEGWDDVTVEYNAKACDVYAAAAKGMGDGLLRD